MAEDIVEERLLDTVDVMELREVAVAAEPVVVGIAGWEFLVPDQVVGSRALSVGWKESDLE